nr:MAG TPA: hypothetical protein [Caudoviricetes sp.]
MRYMRFKYMFLIVIKAEMRSLVIANLNNL